jgi:hypothetical protein
MSFVLIREAPAIEERLYFRLLSLVFPTRYPRWEGSYEGGEFAAQFIFDAGPLIRVVRATLYGRGTPSAKPFFEKLQARTGWQAKF